MLSKTLSQQLSDFSFQVDSDVVHEMTMAINTKTFITKNLQFRLFVFLDNDKFREQRQTMITMQYKDSSSALEDLTAEERNEMK